MALLTGSRLGTLEIQSAIGAGGMGEVYRARDTRLGRDVAVKILSATAMADPDYLVRFDREARLLASLNHPNIATIHGIEEIDGVRALVLELVEGETIDERLHNRGPFAPAEAVALARQIADALDAAHQKGVVHRDIKPSNIKVTPDGAVKVLDFGIAKAVRDTTDGATRPDGMTRTGTREGTFLGTARYMSPEQVRAQAVDKRTDIWAFGCVLFEMLSGRAPFHAGTFSDTIGQIVAVEPDWSTLPPSTPLHLVRLLRRCLEKDQRRRLRDLGDVDLLLEPEPQQPSTQHQRSWMTWAAAAAGLLAVAAATAVVWSRPAPDAPPLRVTFQVSGPVNLAESGAFSLSPDGRRIVFVGAGTDGVLRMWVRNLDTLDTQFLSGTESEVDHNTTMFWSPDSRFIAFYAHRKVRVVSAAGGVPRDVCRVNTPAVGGSWNADGVIVVGDAGGGLLRCPAAGGEPVRITNPASTDPSEIHLFPVFLPDGRHLLYLRISRVDPVVNGIYVTDSQGAAAREPHERLIETGFSAEFVADAAGGGRLLFVRESALWSVPFDPSAMRVTGDPVRIASPIGSFRDGAFFSSVASALVYRAPVDYQLTWRDRAGADLGSVGEPGQYNGLALSPDGSRAAVLRENRVNRADLDIWMLDLARNVPIRLTTDPSLESIPAWSATGQGVVYAMGHDGVGLWSRRLDAEAPSRVLLPAANDPFRVNPLLTTLSVSSDDKFLLFTALGQGGTGSDIWVLPLDGDHRPSPLLQQPADQTHVAVSPDGKWLAYVSNEAGGNAVYVRRLSIDPEARRMTAGAATRVSAASGSAPRWRRDSQEVFYLSSASAVMAARVTADVVERPVELFRAPGMLTPWGVAPDGKRFLILQPVQPGSANPFTVVLNWQAAGTSR